jgi:hypothetical protein
VIFTIENTPPSETGEIVKIIKPTGFEFDLSAS